MPPQISTKTSWRGIFAALLTPLTEEENLDIPATEGLIHALLSEGQSGLYLAGGTGEEYAISDRVRIEVFALAAKLNRGLTAPKTMIAHVGGVPTKRALLMARAAADSGCDAIAAIAPHGGQYSYDEISHYYATLARESPLPLLVYHAPHSSGYDFDREQLSRWLEVPNILGMKFTSSDLFKMERLIALHPESLIYHGADQLLMHGLNIGAQGGIGTTYNLLGPLALSIFDHIEHGRVPAARKAQANLNGFIESFKQFGGLRTFKALAARVHQWPSCYSPAPGKHPTEENVEALNAALLLAQKSPGESLACPSSTQNALSA